MVHRRDEKIERERRGKERQREKEKERESEGKSERQRQDENYCGGELCSSVSKFLRCL